MSGSGILPWPSSHSRRCCAGWPSSDQTAQTSWPIPWVQSEDPASDFNAPALDRRLQTSQAKIYSILESGIPKAHVTLPTLNTEMLDAGHGTQGYHLVGMGSLENTKAGLEKPTDLEAKAAQSRRKLEEGFAELDAIAYEHLRSADKNARFYSSIPFGCAIVSLVVSLIMAWIRVGPPFAALVGGLTMSAGIYVSWRSRAQDHFILVHSVVDKAMSKLYDSLEMIDYAVVGPMEELKLAIDTMAREQRPLLDMGKSKGVDVPSPLVLKEPLAGYDTELADSVLGAKWEVSKRMEKILNSSFSARLPTSKRLWELCLVMIPCDILLIANGVIGLALAFALTPPVSPYDYVARHIQTFSKAARNATLAASLNITVDVAAHAASLMANNHSMTAAAAIATSENHSIPLGVGFLPPSAPARMLKGGHGRGRHGPGMSSANQGPRIFHGVVLLGAPVVFDGAMTTPSPQLVFAYMFPVLCQILLCAVELVGLRYLTRKPKILAFANSSILAMQEAIDDVVNGVVGPKVDKVNLQLRLVRWQADTLFGKLNELKR